MHSETILVMGDSTTRGRSPGRGPQLLPRHGLVAEPATGPIRVREHFRGEPDAAAAGPVRR